MHGTVRGGCVSGSEERNGDKDIPTNMLFTMNSAVALNTRTRFKDHIQSNNIKTNHKTFTSDLEPKSFFNLLWYKLILQNEK